MGIKIALAGNPNCGKTTLFNALTGSNQFVGNWPGVTVEKKEGKLKGYKDVIITDLPGIYSLSPYTLEEVVARDYLIDERPDAILNIIDGTNLERNLYLTTQLMELGCPVIIAINMMDVVEKNGDKINISQLSKELGCPVVEISALKNKGIAEVTSIAVDIAEKGERFALKYKFNSKIESVIWDIQSDLLSDADESSKRWFAIKLFERDEKVIERLRLANKVNSIEKLITNAEEEFDDDSESIITNERYEYISSIIKDCYKRKNKNALTTSDKIDKIVTNRILALPIFAVVMFIVYYVSVTTVGDWVTGWTNDTLFGEWIIPGTESLMTKIGCADWLSGLICDGIVGGVGAVIGFVPQMLVLFTFLAFLESCGYMARIAFVMDRIFRRFGLSGKSFIPMLIGSGCGVPAVMASRTIESDRDRKMTIMTTTFVPCGAKMPIVALVAGALFNNAGWVATSAYFIGIGAIIISGIILKKTKMFSGDPAPFVMELPSYHMPTLSNLMRSMWERGWSFIKKAGSIILLSSILIWFLGSFGIDGGLKMVDETTDSLLYNIGNALAWIFKPLGFGQWQAVVATIMGLVAKEEVVGVFGTLSAMGDADLAFELVESGAASELAPIAALFISKLAAYSFLVFNLLCAPCFAAIGAIKREMNNAKWTAFAIIYQTVLAYIASLCIYQIGTLITAGTFGIATAIAFLLVAFVIFLLFRPAPNTSKNLNYK